MSEEDAEIALLHQLQAGQAGVAWGEEGANGAAEGELPSNIEHNNEEVKRENVAVEDVSRVLSPGAVAVTDGGDHDQSSVAPVPAITIAGEQPASRSSSRGSTRKPKTVGGFLADDSDEDYEASTPQQASVALKTANSNLSTRAISPSPLQNSVSQQDLQQTPENQGDSMATTQSTSTVPVNSSAAGVPSVPAPATQVLISTGLSVPGASLPKARLPHDRAGILEDRIKEDPRGDLDAWLSLISEHRKRNKLDEARAVYERFLKVFPHAAEIWVAYLEMELEYDNFTEAENIFNRCLRTVYDVQVWSIYLNYIRRRNDLNNDPNGVLRKTVGDAYEYALGAIGTDKDAGKIWQEYIQFMRSAPGQLGGREWHEQQKMDHLRAAYQRAVVVPMSAVNALWKEYDSFEMNLNKMTGRKFLQEKSPAYMSARAAVIALEPKLQGLSRTTLPKLPPFHGFEGETEYMRQVELWNGWIAWEKEDPLTLLPDELPVYRKRLLHLYRQAVMALRFWPEMWAEATDWCYANDYEEEAGKFLDDGIAANPESSLLAFRKADRIESTLSSDESDLVEKGAAVRAPFDKLLDTLYDMIKQLKVREARDLVKLEESLALDASISAIISKAEDDDEENDKDKIAREADKAAKVQNIQAGYASQAELLSRTISFAWIALMRAMRRVQGKGSPKDSVGGSRKVFADARARGKLTSDVYVAAALIEHNVYKDPAGTKIFERGAKLFPEDATLTLEYLKHLLSVGDLTNARVTFETVVGRLTTKAQALEGEQKTRELEKAKPLFAQFHKYESQYGELSQISKLEQRMAELFPEDPKLSLFASRFSSEGFDPLAVRIIVSPAIQMRPITTMKVMQSIEKPPSVHNSPRPQYVREASPRPQPPPQYLQAVTNSPKRPFQSDDTESELNRPRKLARGESPLKGAAGRRLDQQKRLQPNYATSTFTVPRDITFLLSIIPRAEEYKHTRFNPESLVRLLRETIVPDYSTWKDARDQSQPPPPQQMMQQQQQRYDGMPPNNYNTQQRGIPPPVVSGMGVGGGYQGYTVSGPGNSPLTPLSTSYSDPYSAGGVGMGMIAHQRDAYSRSGLPSAASVPSPLLPPRRPGSGSGWNGSPGSYDVGAGVGGGGGQGGYGNNPLLQPARDWYYRG